MENQPAQTPKPTFGFGPAYNFRLRLHLEGPFAGQSLWELARIRESGQEDIVCDADKLENCLDNLVGVLQADGY